MESFPFCYREAWKVTENTKGPRTTWRKEGRWPKVYQRSQDLWQVTGCYGHITWLIKRPAERSKTGGIGSSQYVGCSMDIPEAQKKGYRESSVITQAGTGWGGGCCFSRIKDKTLENLNKDP